MPNKLTHEEFVSQLKEINPNIKVNGLYISTHEKIQVECKICKHKWPARPSGLKRQKGCPICAQKRNNKKRKHTHEQFIKDLKKVTTQINVLGRYIDNSTKIPVECKVCAHKWPATPNGLKRGRTGCPVCGIKRRAEKKTHTHEQFIKDLLQINSNIKVIGRYIKAQTKIEVSCKICDHHWRPKPCGLKNGLGCPRCAKMRQGIGKNELEHFTPYLHEILPDNYTTTPQYPVYNKVNGYNYFIDFYIPEENLAIEYDEEHHNRHKQKDNERQEYIESQLGCKFIRISDREFMKDHTHAKELLCEYVEIKRESIENLFV
jgi:very-short-patch-repair endonuclease